MKKLFALLSLSLFIGSCSEDIRTNTPGFQAKKDNVLWKATDASVSANGSGGLTITAFNNKFGNEELQMNISSNEVGTYYFGTMNSNQIATYDYLIAGESNSFNTSSIEGPVFSISGLLTQGTGYQNNGTANVLGGTGNGAIATVNIDGGSVVFVSMLNKGTGYTVGDVLTIQGGNTDATFTVTSVTSSGGIQTFTLTTNGSNYQNIGNGALTSTNGSGSGLRVAINVDNTGKVRFVQIVSRGDGYQAGDLITITGGNNNATFTVRNVQNSNGELVIESIENGTYSGTFKLTAVDSQGNTITFSEGNFYRIPLR